MLGQTGAGKTHICSAVTKTLIDKGLDAIYVVWDDFVENLNQERYDEGNLRALDKYKEIEVLYIDDFLKGKITDSSITTAYRLLNYRYNRKLTTLISSEYLLSDLYKIDGALAGRIEEMAKTSYVIQISKDDSKNYRMTNNWANEIGTLVWII